MHASTRISLSAFLTLALAVPALAQDSRRPTSSGTATGGSAESRGGSSSGGSSAGSSSTTSGGSTMSGGNSRGGTAAARPAREPQTAARRPSGQAVGAGPAVPAYSRPRGDRAAQGQAVERGDNRLPSRGGNTFYYSPYFGYNSYGYYGYPTRYGYYPVYTGFGYFYYDPFWGTYRPGYGYGVASTRYTSKGDRDYDIGSLRLKVAPSHAEVYVDGLYRGVVDDFDGVFQRLKLEAGAHRLEIRAPGYEPLVFDVLVTRGETTTYRGSLKR
jgi:hypothetical protein